MAVVETPAAVRVLVGDVMGHGPRAGETAAEVGHAFRRLAVRQKDPPQVIAARLDEFVASREERERHAYADDAEEQRRREEFVTAQFIDVPRGGTDAEARIVSCGHPPPLVLSGGRATFLDALASAPPLGLLGLAGGVCPRSCPLGAGAGDTVLLYTDGVTEARDKRGVPYPFAVRAAAVARDLAAALSEAIGNALIEALRTDLLSHADGALRDDATLMYLWLADEPRASVPAGEEGRSEPAGAGHEGGR